MLLTATAASAQPKCNGDGTVTFLYKNDSAKTVQVDVQFAGRNPMTRNADGIWTATLGPAAPDMYPYCFIVDGVSVMDPENPQYFPNEGFKNSLLEIPGNGSGTSRTPGVCSLLLQKSGRNKQRNSLSASPLYGGPAEALSRVLPHQRND